MRVCFISGEFPPLQGGVGDYTRVLAQALSQQHIEPHVLTTLAAGPAAAFCVHPCVTTWNWRALPTLTRQIQEIAPAMVHIQYQTAAYGMHPAINFLPFWLRRRGLNLRLLITYHDLRVPYLFPKAGRLRWWVTLAPARWSDAVIVTNPTDWETLSALQQGTFARRHRLTLIPIGSNIEPVPPAGFERQTWRTQMGFQPDEILLVYFGFLNPSKGGETLIRGLDQVRKWGYNCRLVMLGGPVGASDPTNQAYLAHIQALIQTLGLTDYVYWTGFVPDEQVSAHLFAADMAVLPYQDGASFRRGSLMAALVHGVPVITTQPQDSTFAGTWPQLIDGQNARLVPPGDAQQLARAIAELAQDAIRRHQLGQAGRQLARAFAWDRIAAQHKTLYLDLIETNR